MGYANTSRVLTMDGYVPVTDLVNDMIIPTPLGNTKIIYAGPFAEYPDVGVYLDQFRLYGMTRVLTPSLNWSVFRNDAWMKQQMKTGFLSDDLGGWLDSERGFEAYSFLGLNVNSVEDDHRVIQNLEYTMHCRVATENHLLVIDSFLVEGYRLPHVNGKLKPQSEMSLPLLTHDQLNMFKDKYF